MDCGPACLTAMLGGFGVSASYGRLREACQTDVDGTSIDTLEEIAVELGLEAEQVMIPVDHVLLAEAEAMPAITVIRLPGGDNHFVVMWGVRAGRLQLMDPAVGRRWAVPRRFLEDLYVHEMDVPAEGWRDWAGSDDFRRPLAKRLRTLGIEDPGAEIDRALAHPGWRAIASLDAAARMIQTVIDADGIAPGRDAALLALRLASDSDADAIPAEYWSARAGGDAETLRVRGAVMIRVTGVRPAAAAPRSPELAAALAEPPPRPWHTLARAIASDEGWRLGAMALGLVIVACGAVGEAVLFRALFDVSRELTSWPQLAGAMIALVGVLLALALVEVPLLHGIARLGRNGEARLRIGFLTKLPRLGIAYLRSRPQSDMAERSHHLYQLRELPMLGASIARIVLEIAVTAVALCWLAPSSIGWVLLLVAAVIVPPLVVQRALAERDLRVRTHAGSLARFYLDAFRGAVPIRTHGVGRALRDEHEGRLVEWVRAARSELRVAISAAALQALLAFGLAVTLVIVHADRAGQPAGVLLLAYWALTLPLAGLELTSALRELPGRRSVALRMLEPLGAIDDEPASSELAVRQAIAGPLGAVAIELHGVSVVAGGHPILRELELAIGAGEHVAIVGRSGAGKSSLLGLLLGWVRPASGEIRLDGVAADRAAIAALRPRIAWVDPSVHLWNASLADNLAYGAPGADIAATIRPADLEPLMARLPEGLGTPLGEGGGLVSGGEGQRVRFGRALAAEAPPSLVLLDEPFRGLDRGARHTRLQVARERWSGATLLCATHDLAETLTFPRVLVVDEGRIVEDGTPSVLAADPNSRLAALLAEEAGASAAWARWRRLTLEAGQLVPTEEP
jgi:ATP-binding cassette subfamily B protein